MLVEEPDVTITQGLPQLFHNLSSLCPALKRLSVRVDAHAAVVSVFDNQWPCLEELQIGLGYERGLVDDAVDSFLERHQRVLKHVDFGWTSTEVMVPDIPPRVASLRRCSHLSTIRGVVIMQDIPFIDNRIFVRSNYVPIPFITLVDLDLQRTTDYARATFLKLLPTMLHLRSLVLHASFTEINALLNRHVVIPNVVRVSLKGCEKMKVSSVSHTVVAAADHP